MDAATHAENVIDSSIESIEHAWHSILAQVTIIIPVYHGERFILNCLDSLDAQTYKNFQVIIVLDDMDYDGAYDIIVEHPLYRDGRILILASSSKSSPAAARNKGMEWVTSPFVCFMDVDDTWMEHKLDVQIRYMQQSCVDVSFTSGWWHRDFGSFILITDSDTLDRHFSSCMFIWSSVMFRMAVLDMTRRTRGYIFDTQWPQCDDGELLVYLHSMDYEFGALATPLVHIHEHGGNLTQGNLWAANWWPARTWFRHGYYLNACRYIVLGIGAVVSDKLHIRKQLRKLRMKWNGARIV